MSDYTDALDRLDRCIHALETMGRRDERMFTAEAEVKRLRGVLSDVLGSLKVTEHEQPGMSIPVAITVTASMSPRDWARWNDALTQRTGAPS